MLLGFITFIALYYVLAFLFFILLLLFGAAFSLTTTGLDLTFADGERILESFGSEAGGVVIGAVLIILYLLMYTLANSFFIAGAYGAVCAPVFRGHSSIGSFFSAGFGNLWKMFGQQVLLLLFFMVPVLLLVLPFGLLVETGDPSESFLAVPAGLLIILLYVGYALVSLHAPLFLIVERTGVWDSIRHAFRLATRKLGQTLLSGLIALALFFGILLLFLLISVVIFVPLGIFLNEGEIGEVAGGLLSVLLGLLFLLLVLPYAFSASLLSIVHRYKSRLRSFLFPDEPNREGMVGGEAPGHVGGGYAPPVS